MDICKTDKLKKEQRDQESSFSKKQPKRSFLWLGIVLVFVSIECIFMDKAYADQHKKYYMSINTT